MDLNHLLERHQLSLMQAAAAGCVASRHSHQGLADGYAQRVRALQQSSGAGAMMPHSPTARAAAALATRQRDRTCRAR